MREACGEAALYFDPTSRDSLVAAMARIIADPGERARLIELGHANARRFSWSRSADALLAILAEMVDADSARGALAA